MGRGKSFIVDTFCEVLNQKKLLRIHQYLFMLQIHEHMNDARKNKNVPIDWPIIDVILIAVESPLISPAIGTK